MLFPSFGSQRDDEFKQIFKSSNWTTDDLTCNLVAVVKPDSNLLVPLNLLLLHVSLPYYLPDQYAMI